MTRRRAPAASAISWASSRAARDSGEPSKPTPMVRSSRPCSSVAARRDEDGARRAVQRSRGHVAGQDATHAPAVRGADHDEVGAMGDRGAVQRAAGRAVGDHERVRRHAGQLDLFQDGLDRTVVDGLLVLAVGAPAEVVVEGKGVHGDEVAGEDALQRGGERERIATALAAVDADDDGLEHGVLLFVLGLRRACAGRRVAEQ